ncbi:uncharacterized protein LOC130141380 isoform X1 [Falco biarmicus]|uniref:uncharacterized protein LOC119152365 isoform X1 n=1 Tax=Falco rusticolus TaxID=120794 RepID=UPI0018869E4D|nr:uncharacterized protein LOC119152365 isoform X1 [Falco rusticolus]XP_037253447.1 uncharacterized protein LOC119152365 isoform X1 [Falco rusticolus]XP_056178298.1 uncharacterized protein LOC130141380 isoform X1 [Falco biarmicus]XP_056178307.1 uncharacterized protein LOC130141380 isoform X1 [Falco biarmicus]
MDRYRYFIFNQRSMVVLGLFQLAFSTVCVVSGFIDDIFRTEAQLGKTRAPIWAGMVMGVPGVLALFSSQRKNPVLVNVLIVASIISCIAIFIIIVYSSFTLNYGEEEEPSSVPVHVMHTALGAEFLTSQIGFQPRTQTQRKMHPNLHHISEWLEKVVKDFKAAGLKMRQGSCKKFFIFKDDYVLFLVLLKNTREKRELLNAQCSAKITVERGGSADGFGHSDFV